MVNCHWTRSKALYELEVAMICWVRCLRALQADLGVAELREQQQQRQGPLFVRFSNRMPLRACVLLLAMVNLQLKAQGCPCQMDPKVLRLLQK